MNEDSWLESAYEERFVADIDLDEEHDEVHDCSNADRSCDNCLTSNLPDYMDEPN